MHKDKSLSSVTAESLGQTGPSKFEKFLLVSPGFFVFVAGVVFLTRSLDLYSVCDASLMFLIAIGWVVGCRKISQLEVQVDQADREKKRLELLNAQAKDISCVQEERVEVLLRNSPLLMGAVELDGNVVTDLYENAEAERFFGKVLAVSDDKAATRAVARTETIFTWVKRYQESCWIKKPVQFEYEYPCDEGSRWLSVTVAQTAQGSLGQQRFCYMGEDISERKKAQKSLSNSHEQLTVILDTYPDAIFSLDSEWRLTYLNNPAKAALGYGREIIGRVFWELYPELIGSVVWTQYARAMNERITVDFDVFHGPDDNCFQVRAMPCQGGLAIFLRDVTSERQTINAFADNDRQLRRRLAELETLYHSNPMGLASFDKHLRFVRINETLAQLNGVRVEASLGQPLGEVLPFAYDLIAPLLTQVIETGAAMYVQFENAKRNEGESWRHCMARAYPLRDDAGAISGVSLVQQDTTSEWHAEQALRESEQRFRQLAEALPEIVWTADANGNIDYCNARWYAYTKCAGQNALAQWSSFIHPGDLGKWRESWARSIGAGEDYEIEYQFLRHDGVYRWFLCRAQAVFNNNGEIVKWFGTCTDIHSHKRVEHLLRRSNEDLKQLTAAATQDLQEHLRSITSFCQLAQQHRGEIAGETENYLETILETATPMNALLQNLRSYSVVSAEQQRSVAAG